MLVLKRRKGERLVLMQHGRVIGYISAEHDTKIYLDLNSRIEAVREELLKPQKQEGPDEL